MEPRPTNRAIPFNVLPIPSFTAVTISENGIPAARPMTRAPIRIEIMAWILNLMISTSKSAKPTRAAIISLVGSSIVSVPIINTLHSMLLCSLLFLCLC